MIGMREAPHLCVVMALAWWSISSPAMAEERLTFERDVRPILKEYCLDCHGGNDAPKGKLDLRLKRFAERGGESGPALVAGKPEESYLLERLRDAEMPPGEKKVPREKIAVIERWIAQGAATLQARAPAASAGRRHLPRRAGTLVVPARPPAGSAAVPRRRPGTDADRCVRAGEIARARSSPSHPRPTGGR